MKKKRLRKSKEKDGNLNLFGFLKNNIPLILLGLYALSFINYYIYYNSFEIPIFNYIGLNDMLFFSLEYIFRILLLITIAEILIFIVFTILFGWYERFVLLFIKKKWYLYGNASKKNKKRILNIFNKQFDNSIFQFGMTTIFILLFVVAFSSYKLVLFPTALIYLIYYIEKGTPEKFWDITLMMATGIIFISMLFSTIVNSYDKRFEKDNNIISFYENSIFVSTDTKLSCYNYLGETSTHIFLYDIENKESKIYGKENVSEFTIKNINKTDKYIKKIQENSIFKFLFRPFYDIN